MRTKDIAEALAGRLDGDGAMEIDRIVHPARAERLSDLALAISPNAVAALGGSKAQAVVVSADHPVPPGSYRAIIAISEGRIALANLTALFDRGPEHVEGVHPTAVVAPDAKLGPKVSIGAFAVVGARSRIGAGTLILPQVTIGADVAIGAQSLVHAGARIGDRCVIGDRVIVHPNAVIGSDGFSFAPDLMSTAVFAPGVTLTRVHSLGNVVIGDDVEIGAGTTIDRGTYGPTVIGEGTKIDDQVMIAHNCRIGRHNVLCAQVGIAGSTTSGDYVVMAGQVGVRDHVHIGDRAVLLARSGVINDIPDDAHMVGIPATPEREQMIKQAALAKLPEMRRQLKQLQAAVDKLVPPAARCETP